MEAIILPTKRKFSWRVFLIVLVLTLMASLLKAPIAIANGYADQPGLWTSIILQVTLSNFVLFGLPGAIGLLLANQIGLGLPLIEGWVDKKPLKGKIGKIADRVVGCRCVDSHRYRRSFPDVAHDPGRVRSSKHPTLRAGRIDPGSLVYNAAGGAFGRDDGRGGIPIGIADHIDLGDRMDLA
jgi:hypothetical protein